MKKKEKEQILKLVKKCACFYPQGKSWRLEVSANISNPELIHLLRVFFTEEDK